MGWSIGYDPRWKRDIGYGVPAICDHPGCKKKIDRGLGYVCGGAPYGGDQGCGLYFCEKHLWYSIDAGQNPCQVCRQCFRGRDPFKPKPDTKEWIEHKATHPSWAKWRRQQKKSKLKK